jgi:hypothetical protein
MKKDTTKAQQPQPVMTEWERIIREREEERKR